MLDFANTFTTFESNLHRLVQNEERRIEDFVNFVSAGC